ncbi:MAG: alpha/beta hydrolase [Gammaproteobacteria bacterium]|nr:alpha/beta hydrolase [Gammaproteobacteria bacterium]
MSEDAPPALTGEGEPRPAQWESRFAQVQGLRLHYLDYGGEGKPPMLFVHGGAASGHWFDFVAADFIDRYHVLALDQRGHGDSEWAVPPDYRYATYAADLAGFMDALNLQDVTLVGHSMGGMVSLCCTAHHPGDIGRLVVIDSTMRMTPERVANLRQVGERGGRMHTDRASFESHFRLRPAGTRASPAVVRHLAALSGRRYEDGGWRHKFDRAVYATREAIDGFDLWGAVRVPAAVIAGGESDRISDEIEQQIRERQPGLMLQRVPGAGHHVTLDNPPGFVEALERILERAHG